MPAEDPPEDVRDPQPGLEGGRSAAPDQPEVVKRARLEALVLVALFVGIVVLYDNRVSLLGKTVGATRGLTPSRRTRCWNRRSKRPCAW